MQAWRTVFAACCLGAFFGLCASSALAVGGLEAVEHKCSTCHDLKRLCRGLDTKDKQNWAATITRMVEKRGAKLSPQDQTAIYNYLIRQTSATASFCK